MSTNIQTLLLGALIGFVVSILTTVLNHILEKGRNSQKHKWELEERAQVSHREINNKRLDQLEDYIKGKYESFCQLSEQESNILYGLETNSKQREDFIVNIKDSFRKLHTVYLVNDDEFYKIFDRLQGLIDQEADNYVRIINENKESKLDKNKERVLIKNQREEISKTYANILRIIDDLRNK